MTHPTYGVDGLLPNPFKGLGSNPLGLAREGASSLGLSYVPIFLGLWWPPHAEAMPPRHIASHPIHLTSARTILSTAFYT